MKGRPLQVPRDASFRPTMDRVRQSLSNILTQHVDWGTLQVCDLFAGSGACGLEFLSRGAQHCTFVEHARGSLSVLHRNLSALGLDSRSRVYPMKVEQFLSTQSPTPFDLIFIDPPYREHDSAPLLELILTRGWIHPQGLLVWEHAAKDIPSVPQPWIPRDSRRYGDTGLTLVQPGGTT